MGGFGGGEGLVCEGAAGFIDGALERNAEVSKRLLSWMSWGSRDPSTHPSKQVVLQIEFASSRAQLLDRLDNLNTASEVLNCRSQVLDSYLDCLGNNLSNN